jgi:aminocarboxymuconate-semialdehyde decarboxylase
MTMPSIDVHFHVLPPLFVDRVRHRAFDGVVEVDDAREPAELVFRPPAGTAVESGPSVRPQLVDARLILAEMDRRKLDAAAISPPPQLFAYWAHPEVGERIARAVNDGLAEMRRAHPDRFLPLASLPLQDAIRAARELERACGELALHGAALCTHVNGVDLDVSHLDPLFAAAERLDVPLFLHPQNAGDPSRLQDYHLWNLVGFMMETATAGARLIMAGVFERHPRLKIVLAHGGGFLPYQLGRLDHGHKVRPELNARLPKPPTAYLGNIFCDSLVHDGRALRFLIDRIGADHVVLGSDHPFDMGCDAPVEAVRALDLPPADENAIIGDTLAKLLKVR